MTPDVSVVLPFRNAGSFAAANIGRLHAFLSGLGPPFEIVAVDDGSEDRTSLELARGARALDSVRVLRAREHLGKGACLAEGLKAARAEKIVVMDGDLPFPLERVKAVLKALEDADVAIAVRRRAPGLFSPLRDFLSSVFSALVRDVLLPGIDDSQAGLKAFRREAARLIVGRQRCAGFAFDVEALAIARRFGLTIRQVEVPNQAGGPSTVRPLRDGLRLLWKLGLIWLRLRVDAYSRCERQAWEGRVREFAGSQRDAELARVETSRENRLNRRP